MAGLTREQRAAKAAAMAAQTTRTDDSDDIQGLIAMAKDGDELLVHPTCVESHLDCGWKVVS